jgi:hypothetical protein
MLINGTRMVALSSSLQQLKILSVDSNGSITPYESFPVEMTNQLNGLNIGNALALVNDTILLLETGRSIKTFKPDKNWTYALSGTSLLDSTQLIRDMLTVGNNSVFLASMDGSVIESAYPLGSRIQARRKIQPDVLGPVQAMAIDGNMAYSIDQYRGLLTLDATDLNSLKPVGTFSGSDFWGSTVYKPDIDVKGKTAAVVDGNTMFFLLDVSNPISPTLAYRAVYPNVGNGNTSHGAAIHGNYVYHVGDGDGLMRIIDITNHAAPLERGPYMIPLHPPGALPSYNTIGTHGNYAYVDGCAGLEVLSLANPESPIEKYLVAPQSGNGCFATGISFEGNFAYETIGNSNSFGGEVRVFDIQNPENPKLVDSLQIAGWPYDISVKNGYLFISCDRAGMIILKHSPSNGSAIHYRPVEFKLGVSRKRLPPGYFFSPDFGAFDLLGRRPLSGTIQRPKIPLREK